jgi:conjugative transfer signal peptidase TraF
VDRFPAARVRVGDYVVVRLPRDTAALAAARDYLPRSIPILKQIAALGGQYVCIRDAVVYIDGSAKARALAVDGNGRPLTAWAHCRVLLEGESFLLNLTNPGSFDSRYFGPVDVSFVRGRAIPLSTTDTQ